MPKGLAENAAEHGVIEAGESAATRNGNTAAASLGQKMHRLYKSGDIANGIKIKEFKLPSGKRIDFIDLENKTIYELKPNNPRAIRLGNKQLEIYKNELHAIPRFKGIQWQTILDTY